MDIFPIKINGLIPPKRSGSAGFNYKNQIYIFGGLARNILFDDLWQLNLKTWKWKKIELENFPEKRWGHTFNFLDKKAFVLGGRCGSKPQNMGLIFYFNLDEVNQWVKFQISSNNKPKKRYAHLNIKKDDNTLLIFGGHGGRARFYNDLWQLTIEKDNFVWTEILTTGEIPECRSQAGGLFHQDKFYVIGGTNNQVEFSDICILDWKTKVWKRISISLFGLCKHTVHLIPHSNKIFVFGGKFKNKKKSYFWEESQPQFNFETIGYDIDNQSTFVIPRNQTLTCCRSGHLMFNRDQHFFSVFGETKEKYETNKVIQISINSDYSDKKSLEDAFKDISDLRKIILELSKNVDLLLKKN